MTKKARKERGKVRMEWDEGFPLGFKSFTSPRDGYGLPGRLTAVATDDPDLPGVVVTVKVEVENGRARARSVLVDTDNPAGVGWTTLASVRTRDIVATAVLSALWRMEAGDEEGTIRYVPLSETDVDMDEVREIVQNAVGYSPNMDRFERVRS
jgi:hypothetical protein